MPDTTSQVVTYDPDGTDPRWLGHEGSVDGLSYSFTLPGGCDQLTCTLQVPPTWRSDALNPGRIVRAIRGGAIAWAGRLDEPQPGADGWAVTAHGAGAYGDDYLANYSTAWGSGVFNTCVDNAIGRGLDWIRGTDIGAVSGLWTGQKVDSSTQTVGDLLNLGTHKGGLTWTVRTVARGNVLSVFALPTTANRILICGDPVGRSITEAPTTIYIRYQTAWDTNKDPATYATTSVTSSGRENAHGRTEDYMDLSSAGVMTSGAAQTVATNALKRYQRASFTDGFTVQPGQLLSQGGQPADLGIFWQDGIQAMVCELWLADYAYGGEVSGGPVNVLIGSYVFNPDGTATITPFESARHDWSSVMGAAIDATPTRVKPHHRHRRWKTVHH
jgi:hypothetical protein